MLLQRSQTVRYWKLCEEITRANEFIYWKGEEEHVSQEAVNLARQKKLRRTCRCLKYLFKVNADIQSLFTPRFLSFLCLEVVHILPLRWDTGETF